MKIQILGTGCPKCNRLSETVETAAKELQLEYELEKVTNITQIMSFGVMCTPALVINGKVVLSGKVPSLEQAKEILSQ